MKTALVKFEELQNGHIYKMLDALIEVAYLNACVDRMDCVDTEERQYVINGLNKVINIAHEYKNSFCKQVANFILGFYAPTNINEAEILFCNKLFSELNAYLKSYKFREHTAFQYNDQTDSVFSSYMLSFHQELTESITAYIEGLPIKECVIH
jgi:hypothetical protein